MYYVYIIQSEKNNRYYTGFTKDINQRLAQHNNNKTKSLKHKGPFKLVYSESFEHFGEARARESQIKRYRGGKAFKKLVN